MIIISTFNIQNDRKKNPIEKNSLILNYIEEYKIDVLNLQEVYKNLDIKLEKGLKEKNYQAYGTYRFHTPKVLNAINEKTPIITNKKVCSHKTYHLPFLPSLLKRVMTKIEIEIDGKMVSIYNTHLDYQYDQSRKRELKKIWKIIRKDKNLIILTGDFNLKTNNSIFQKFIEDMKKLKIEHIDIKEKTWKKSKYHRAIDHVFASQEFTVKEKKLITDLPISDHYPILMKLDWSKRGK